MSETKIYSEKYGHITVIDELDAKRDKADISIWFKVDERNWRYFRRTSNPFNGPYEEHEVNWNGYSLGGRAIKHDIEAPVDWFYYTIEAKINLIENEIGNLYEMDEVPWYHVEPVQVDKNYEKWSDQTLWDLEHYMHTRIGELELELRDLRREHAAVWRVGEDKYNWSERL